MALVVTPMPALGCWWVQPAPTECFPAQDPHAVDVYEYHRRKQPNAPLEPYLFCRVCERLACPHIEAVQALRAGPAA